VWGVGSRAPHGGLKSLVSGDAQGVVDAG